MSYIDLFVMPVPKDRIDEYKQLARDMAPMWKEYGAISSLEAFGDDVPYGELTSFPRSVQCKDNETVAISWIIYASKAERDAASEKMMNDPRMQEMMQKMPTDGARMIFGGFEAFIE